FTGLSTTHPDGVRPNDRRRRASMAKRRPTHSQSRNLRTSGGDDDAFTAAVLELLAWARARTQLLVTAAIVLVVGVVGVIYWVNARSNRLMQAAEELETVRGAAMFQPGTEARAEVRAYIDRFAGTPYEIEAHLLLGELHLADGQADSAAVALTAVA